MAASRLRSTRSRSTWLANLALLGVTFLVFLAALEVVLRVFELGFGEAPLLNDPKVHHKHPTDYVYRRKDEGWGEFGGFLIEYDDKGRSVDPDKVIVYNPARHKRTIAMMGDSMPEAGQVPYKQGYVGLLNQRAAPDVFAQNWGVSTYSPMIYRVQWLQDIKATKPDLVLLMLYSNDVGDDKRYAETTTFDAEGLPVAVAGPPDRVLFRMLRNFYVARLVRVAWRMVLFLTLPEPNERIRTMGPVGGFLEESPEMSPLTDKVMKGIVREVRATGARFVLTAVPSKYVIMTGDKSKADQQWASSVKRWAEQNNVEYIDLWPAFSEYADKRKENDPKPFFFRDIHPNELGHRLIADTIAKALPDFFPQK